MADDRDLLVRFGGEFTDILIERAQGSWLETADGRRILDFTSGQMCATLGHSHPAILEAMREAGDRVVHLYSGFISSDVIGLARDLMAVLPPPSRGRSSSRRAARPTRRPCGSRSSTRAGTRCSRSPAPGTA